MKKVFGIFALLAAVVILPAAAHAQYVAGGTSWFDWANLLYAVVKWAGPMLVLIAVLVLSYNVLMYVIMGDKPDDKKKALQGIGWSILGLAVMLGVWGILGWISSTLRLGYGGTLSQDLIPQVQTCPPFGVPGQTPGC